MPQCILPCIGQLLPADSPLLHCVRAYAQFRFMIGLKCISDERIARLKKHMRRYEKYCGVSDPLRYYLDNVAYRVLQLVEEVYGKDFRFYKQHASAHVIEDIREKGPPTGYSTRPGEGFHQEVNEAFDQTNCKNTDPQVFWQYLLMSALLIS